MRHGKAESSLSPPRPPVTRAMIVVLASHLNPADPLDACCLAAASAAFWGQLRLGEILSPWESSFPSSHISRRIHLSSPFNNNGSRKLFLPFTKVKKNKGEEVILCRQRDSSDPDLPLFCYLLPAGLRCLTRRKLLARCNEIWSTAGFKTVSGHSFRIGGTTEMLLSGVPPDVVKALGRWSSDSFLRYACWL